MNPTQHALACADVIERPDSITWLVRPPSRLGKGLPILTAVLTLTFVCALLQFKSILFAIASVALVLIPNASLFVPLTYCVSRSGARVSVGPVTWLEMSWTEVRSIVCVQGGIKLCAFDNPATAILESRRGVTLKYPREMAPRVESSLIELRALADKEAQG